MVNNSFMINIVTNTNNHDLNPFRYMDIGADIPIRSSPISTLQQGVFKMNNQYGVAVFPLLPP
jgi:hypothetical protein